MKVLVWGLGCPGIVLAIALAQAGHEVIGIDVDETRVAEFNSAACYPDEPNLTKLLGEILRERSLHAVKFQRNRAPEADVSCLVVGTPASLDGKLDTSQIEAAVSALSSSLRASSRFHLVVIRSTVPIGVTRTLIAPLLEKHSGRELGRDLGLVVCPEFLREGHALDDFRSIRNCVVGAEDQLSVNAARELFGSLGQTVVTTSFEEAEMLKLVNNAFHALKAGFANEIGRLCTASQIDPAKVMDLVCSDRHLNISSAYLRPGSAFGGACLPKDIAALVDYAREAGVSLPITENILPSNDAHLQAAFDAIAATGLREIGILGLTANAGSADLRHSSSLRLMKQLRDAGYYVCAFDPKIQLQTLSGRNRIALERSFPDYEVLMLPTIQSVVTRSSLVVITHSRPEFSCENEALKNIRVLNVASSNSSFPAQESDRLRMV